MVKKAAARPARYRASRVFSSNDSEGQRRVNVWLSTGSGPAPKRIAPCYRVTQLALIEKLLFAEDKRILDEVSFDSAEWNKYFGIPKPTRQNIHITDESI